MVGGVAGRVQGGQAVEAFSLADRQVRDQHVLGSCGGEGGRGRTAGPAEGVGCARVVLVAVGDRDGGDLSGGGEDGGDVLGEVGAGIEDESAAGRVDQVGVGAVIGHQPRIGGDDPPDAGEHSDGHVADRLGFGEEGHLRAWSLGRGTGAIA